MQIGEALEVAQRIRSGSRRTSGGWDRGLGEVNRDPLRIGSVDPHRHGRTRNRDGALVDVRDALLERNHVGLAIGETNLELERQHGIRERLVAERDLRGLGALDQRRTG